MGKLPASLKRYEGDPRAEQVVRVWNGVLHRDPTPTEISRFRALGTTCLVDQAREIERKELGDRSEYVLQERASATKEFGVSLVSTYNRQCGIATYTENLYAALKSKIRCNVLSEFSRDRQEQSTEDGVIKCWKMGINDYRIDLAKSALEAKNKVIHVQHEWGLFLDNDYFARAMSFLKSLGFKTVATLHTVTDGRREKFLSPYFDAYVVHSESAAACLYGRGVNNVTVIPHGTEEILPGLTKDRALAFVNSLIHLNHGDIFVSYPGFISPNKMQLEVMRAMRIAADKVPNLKFLLIGSHGVGGYDGGLLARLRELETDRIKVVQRFTTKEEMAYILTASDMAVQNYGSTAFSTSGMSHLMMTYGVPTVSSCARILDDLSPSMSLKVDGGRIESIVDAVVKLATDPALRAQFGNAAMAESDRTSWPKVAEMHTTVYRKICEA